MAAGHCPGRGSSGHAAVCVGGGLGATPGCCRCPAAQGPCGGGPIRATSAPGPAPGLPGTFSLQLRCGACILTVAAAQGPRRGWELWEHRGQQTVARVAVSFAGTCSHTASVTFTGHGQRARRQLPLPPAAAGTEAYGAERAAPGVSTRLCEVWFFIHRGVLSTASSVSLRSPQRGNPAENAQGQR